jgi:cytochrome oxidase Cu insertion factor (SCO1/SenC/PrrC family)
MKIHDKRLSQIFVIASFLVSTHISGLLTGCNKPDDDEDPSTELESSCFNWPSQEFSPTNKAKPKLAFSAGDTAVDFTLQDTDGHAYNLYTLLKTKPVLIVFGSFT